MYASQINNLALIVCCFLHNLEKKYSLISFYIYMDFVSSSQRKFYPYFVRYP